MTTALKWWLCFCRFPVEANIIKWEYKQTWSHKSHQRKFLATIHSLISAPLLVLLRLSPYRRITVKILSVLRMNSFICRYRQSASFPCYLLCMDTFQWRVFIFSVLEVPLPRSLLDFQCSDLMNTFPSLAASDELDWQPLYATLKTFSGIRKHSLHDCLNLPRKPYSHRYWWPGSIVHICPWSSVRVCGYWTCFCVQGILTFKHLAHELISKSMTLAPLKIPFPLNIHHSLSVLLTWIPPFSPRKSHFLGSPCVQAL